MAVKYRGSAKDNSYGNRQMLSPSMSVEAPRDSKALIAKATAAFVELLRRTTPEDGATAYLERVDPRFGPRTLVRYSGKSTARNDRGGTIGGRWFLEDDVEGYSFPQIIDSGSRQGFSRNVSRAALSESTVVRVHLLLAGGYSIGGHRRFEEGDADYLTHAFAEGAQKSLCGKIHAEKAHDQTQLLLTCERCMAKLGDHPITNDFPDVFTQRKQRERGLIPNSGSHYVWVLSPRTDTPLSEGPYGPMSLPSAEHMARIAASEGAHDRAVSAGRDPESRAFRIVARYAAHTGARIL